MAVEFTKKVWNDDMTITSEDMDRLVNALFELIDATVVDNNGLLEEIFTILAPRQCINLPEHPNMSDILRAIAYLDESGVR